MLDSYASFGKITHVWQDFYSHTNYVELYNKYYFKDKDHCKNGCSDTKEYSKYKIYDDAVQDKGFKKYLDKNLTSGCYGDGSCKNPNGTHHDDMNQDDGSKPLFSVAGTLAIKQTRREDGKFRNIMDNK